jgi:hypothetical protein
MAVPRLVRSYEDGVEMFVGQKIVDRVDDKMLNAAEKLSIGVIFVPPLLFFMSLVFVAGANDWRDADLIRRVLVATSEITRDQQDYTGVSTETVRLLIREEADGARMWRQTSEPGVIRHRHGGTIEVIPIDQNRRLRLRLTGFPESACITALWGEVLSRLGSSELPNNVRRRRPLFLRGLYSLHLRAEPPFSDSWIFTAEEKEQLTVAQVLAICSSSKSFSMEADFRERMAVSTKAPWD